MGSSKNRDVLSTGRGNILDVLGGRDGRRHPISPRGRQISETVVVDAMKRSVAGISPDAPQASHRLAGGDRVVLAPMGVADDHALGLHWD